jgi:cation:H+ antiporter
VTISAFRLGAVNMAIGNLLGSSLFDILILAVDDIAYVDSPLFCAVSPAHAITALSASMMSGIFILAMLFKPESRLGGPIGWVSLSLLLVYLFSAYAVYLLGHQGATLRRSRHSGFMTSSRMSTPAPAARVRPRSSR